MRLLFTSNGGLGHLHAVLPLALAARAAGHEVIVAGDRGLVAPVTAAGLPAVALLDQLTDDPAAAEMLATVATLSLDDAGAAEAGTRIVADVLIGPRTRLALPELVTLCERWSPAVIVREEFEFAATVAAEALRVPLVDVQLGLSRVRLADDRLAALLDPIRADWGLPPTPGRGAVLRLAESTPSLSQDDDPDTVFFQAPPAAAASRPAELAGLVAGWPIVYVTLGTELSRSAEVFPGHFRHIVAALGEEPVNLVLTVGADNDPAELGLPARPNLRLARYLPQEGLLPHCDLVLCHGGFHTVLGALRHGVPLVLLPVASDQPANSACCAHAGAGVVLPPQRRSAAEIRSAVRAALDDPGYRNRAAEVGAELAALPDPAAAVDRLTAVVGRPGSAAG